MHYSYDATTPEAVNSVVRCIAVSATLPNIADIAAALDANESCTLTGLQNNMYAAIALLLSQISCRYI